MKKGDFAGYDSNGQNLYIGSQAKLIAQYDDYPEEFEGWIGIDAYGRITFYFYREDYDWFDENGEYEFYLGEYYLEEITSNHNPPLKIFALP